MSQSCALKNVKMVKKTNVGPGSFTGSKKQFRVFSPRLHRTSVFLFFSCVRLPGWNWTWRFVPLCLVNAKSSASSMSLGSGCPGAEMVAPRPLGLSQGVLSWLPGSPQEADHTLGGGTEQWRRHGLWGASAWEQSSLQCSWFTLSWWSAHRST